MKAILAALLLCTTLARAEVTSFSVRPSETDSAIKTFDGPHWMYLNRDIVVEHKPDLAQDRHELLLFLPGTGKKGDTTGGNNPGPAGFFDLTADLGYHVIFLRYPNEIAASAVRGSSDPQAFEEFRMALIEGGRTKQLSIEPAESVTNRLVKLLQFLKSSRPDEAWGQFLNKDGSIRWKTIAVSGLSQGGGHAALLGIKHPVTRVVCFGAPKDYSTKLDAPAAWYGEKSATPKSLFFAFNHRQDAQACTPEHQLENLKALKLDTFGKPADVDTETFPYRHARILYTSYPAVTVTNDEDGKGSLEAHTSVVATKNADHWKEVWTYMLTENKR